MQRVNGGLAGLLLSCLKHDTIGTPCRGFQPVSAHAAGCALLSHRQLHFQNQLQVSAAQAQADVPASLVDQIIEFVRNQTQSAQRIDVLRSGLGTVSTDHRKQRARTLLLAWPRNRLPWLIVRRTALTLLSKVSISIREPVLLPEEKPQHRPHLSRRMQLLPAQPPMRALSGLSWPWPWGLYMPLLL